MKTRTTRLAKTAQTTLFALCTFFTLCAAPLVSAQSYSAAKPVAIVALNSVDNFMEDVNFIGSLAGNPMMAEQVKPMVAGFTQGLDSSQPIGLMVQMGEMGPSGALCVPVTDLKQLVGTLMMFGVTSEEQEDGVLEISVQGQTVFAREANGWAFISMMPQMLDGLPEDPGKIIGQLTKDYDVGVRIHVQNVPEQFRQMAVEQLQAGMDAGMRKQAHESDEEFETRREISQLQIEQLKRAINELDELTMGLSLDGEQQRTFLDFVYTAVPGSKLAEQFALNSNPKTNFAGFFQPDAAMMVSFASKASEADIAQIQQVFSAVRKQVGTAIDQEAGSASDEDRAVIKSAVDDFLDAFLATLQGGIVDGGAVLNLAPNSATLVAGGLVGDPGKVESGLKKLTELAEKEDSDFPGVQWNADSHADVQFHTMSVPIPADEQEPRQLFGDTLNVAVGIGQKSAFFALGRDCLDAVKSVIDDSAANPEKSVAPMEMTIALQQFLEVAASMADQDDKANIEMITDMLANSADGRDHVRIVVQPIPNGARTRIEAEEGVLRAIGLAVMQAQMQAAGAQAGF
ncbi:MAG: hypothetical protein MI725_02155 [Pirellulales bacterium]|nr:hypothetical protein [Pirellulales bacterium]